MKHVCSILSRNVRWNRLLCNLSQPLAEFNKQNWDPLSIQMILVTPWYFSGRISEKCQEKMHHHVTQTTLDECTHVYANS